MIFKSHIKKLTKHSTKPKKDKKAKFEADIQDKIDVFNNYKLTNPNANSGFITDSINQCGETDTVEGFYHRAKDAEQAKQEAMQYLNELLLTAVGREAEEQRQAELAEENRLRQIQIDEQQARMDAQQAEIDARQAEFDRVANEAAAKAQAEADEKQRLIDEANHAEQEKKRAIEREEYAKQQAEAAAEQAKKDEIKRQQAEQEAQRIADEKRASNNRHVTKIKKQAKESFMAIGFSEEDSVKAVQALSRSEIKNCSINY